MKKDFLSYTPEELLETREFIAWVLKAQHQEEWETFLVENPEFKSTANKAREIIELLRDRHDYISNNDVLSLWQNIERFDNQQKIRTRQLKTFRLVKYAAILVFALLLGGTGGYWLISQNQESYVFSSTPLAGKGSQSYLSLSNGTMVDLQKQNSKIAMNADQQIVIDNNHVIDLSKNDQSENSKMNEVVIPYGKKSQLILSDGTKVWLNAGSRMAFPTQFAAKKREVFLEGEAYFEVAHNKVCPFWVNTNEISIKVLGTKFDISAYQSDQLTETILIEGKVAVSERSKLGFMKKETIMAPNQKASFDKKNQTIFVKNEHDVEFAIAWTEGWFKFSQQSINQVLNKLERYYNIQFIIDRELPTADLITGKLDLKESIEQVMIALSDVANIQYRVNGDKIYIEKKIAELEMR